MNIEVSVLKEIVLQPKENSDMDGNEFNRVTWNNVQTLYHTIFHHEIGLPALVEIMNFERNR